MISVQGALEKILQHSSPLGFETVPITLSEKRILAKDAVANLTQPPFDASAMDGYAVRSSDATLGYRLRVIGEAPAGKVSNKTIQRGEALRVFTGSVIPNGATHVVVQEDVSRIGDRIEIIDPQFPPLHIRKSGIDFNKGDTLIKKGTRLNPLHLSAMAAANIETVKVYKRPKVAIFANGDELVNLGQALEPGHIISSTPYALYGLLTHWGADPEFLGIIPDNRMALSKVIEDGAKKADLIIPLGGASVGDYDLVKDQFKSAHFKMNFEKIAVKPGKPTWFATRGKTSVLGLPGNPASSLVCAYLFLWPFIKAMTGETETLPRIKGLLERPLTPNGPRETYLRGRAEINQSGTIEVTPFSKQDSSLLTPFSRANILLKIAPNAPKQDEGSLVECLLIGDLK